MCAKARPAFKQTRVFLRAHTLAMAVIVCLGRRTLTGLLTASGRQFEDWSAAYRLFQRERFDTEALFDVSLREAAGALAPAAPIAVVFDDTLLPKRGRKVAEACWRHDPQGPPFEHQIAWAQRIVEFCVMLPADPAQPSSARAIPVDLAVQKATPKPSKKASPQQRKDAARMRRENASPRLAAGRFAVLRQRLDAAGHADRLLLGAADGGFTNKTVFRDIPARCALVGRIRKDAKLCTPPPPAPAAASRGRTKLYGEPLPTPEQLLRDPSIPWQLSQPVFAAGEPRCFAYKTLERCRWRNGAGARDLRLVVVKPLSSTPHAAGRRLFFAHPGYLICSDPALSIEQILQIYVWRWEIEVAFQEQKTLLGMGQAQVRTHPAVSRVVQFQAWSYGTLLLAAREKGLLAPPRPKWQKSNGENKRLTVKQMISLMRSELWFGHPERDNINGFASRGALAMKPEKIDNAMQSAVIYASQ